MSTGRKFRFSLILRCAWPVFGVGFLLAVQTPVQAAPSAYVANFASNTVSVIDTASNTVTTTIPVETRPFGIAVNPDGSRVYVTNYGSNTVSVIDTATNAVTGSAITVGANPRGIAVSPDGSQVYVANEFDNTVSVIDTATNAVTAAISVGSHPYGVAVSPDGSQVYVVNVCASSSSCANGTVSVIDTATNAVTGSPITVGSNPFGVAMSPDGSRVYVTNTGNGTVSVIDTATNAVTAVISVGSKPFGVAVSPDGSRVYVANSGSGTVSVIDTAENAVTAVISVGNAPYGVAVSPDGSRVYVANFGSNTVSVIDTASNTVTGSAITVGSFPEGVAVRPDGSRVYVANQCLGCTNGTVSVIDTASDSVVTTITVGANPSSLGAFVSPGALIATNSSASGVEGEQISGTAPALTNSTDCVSSDTVVQGPADGSLDFDAGTGEYTYTPSSATYVGPDAFTWNGMVSGLCTEADNPTAPLSNVGTVTFTLTVAPPVASDGSVSTAEGQAVTGQLEVTASAGQTPTYAMVIGPRDGTVTLTASTGAFTYTPAGGFAGTDSFTFDAKDSGGTSNMATETVSVMAPAMGGGGALGLDSLWMLGAGLLFSRSRRKKRLSSG